MSYINFPKRKDYSYVDISMWMPKLSIGVWGITEPTDKEVKDMSDNKSREWFSTGSFIKRDEDGEIVGDSITYRFVFSAEDGELPLTGEQVSEWKTNLEQFFTRQKCLIR